MTSVTSGAGGAPARVGLLGGTFDPPHIGHLAAAVNARHQLGLDEVLLVPNGDPWQKRGSRTVTPATTRLELTEAAAQGLTGVRTSAIEVERPGATYTIDTVEALDEAWPGVEIALVVGRDAAEGLETWERHDELLARVRVAVVDRPGSRRPLPDLGEGARWVDIPQLDVSSTDLRRRVAAGAPIDVLTPAAVVELVRRHGLYRDGTP